MRKKSRAMDKGWALEVMHTDKRKQYERRAWK